MSGNYIYLHHVEPKVKLYVPREESFPIPQRCGRGTASTTLDAISTEPEIYQTRGLDSHDSPYWKRNLQMGIHGPGGE